MSAFFDTREFHDEGGGRKSHTGWIVGCGPSQRNVRCRDAKSRRRSAACSDSLNEPHSASAGLPLAAAPSVQKYLDDRKGESIATPQRQYSEKSRPSRTTAPSSFVDAKFQSEGTHLVQNRLVAPLRHPASAPDVFTRPSRSSYHANHTRQPQPTILSICAIARKKSIMKTAKNGAQNRNFDLSQNSTGLCDLRKKFRDLRGLRQQFFCKQQGRRQAIFAAKASTPTGALQLNAGVPF